MTITVLWLVVVGVLIALCAVLAEPWQRQRYDQLAEQGRDRVEEWTGELRRDAVDE